MSEFENYCGRRGGNCQCQRGEECIEYKQTGTLTGSPFKTISKRKPCIRHGGNCYCLRLSECTYMSRAIVLRHSFSNPMWWGFHFYLHWMHHENLKRQSHDPRLNLTLKSMRIEQPASRNPFKDTGLTEEQAAQRVKGKP